MIGYYYYKLLLNIIGMYVTNTSNIIDKTNEGLSIKYQIRIKCIRYDRYIDN